VDFDYAQEFELIKAIDDGLVPEVVRGVGVVEVNKTTKSIEAAANSVRPGSSDEESSLKTHRPPTYQARSPKIIKDQLLPATSWLISRKLMLSERKSGNFKRKLPKREMMSASERLIYKKNEWIQEIH
jgi:hypothetical protein